MVVDIRVGGTHKRLEFRIVSCRDQILKIQSAVVTLLFVHHVQGGDIVVFLCLRHQRTHRLLHRHVLVDHDEIGGHEATDLVLFIGLDQLDIRRSLFIKKLRDDLLGGLVHFFEHIHGVIGVHVFNDLRNVAHVQFLDVLINIFDIGKDLRHALRSKDRI